MSKYQTALETTADVEVIKILAKNISSSEEKHKQQVMELSKLKIEYENQNEKFNMSLLEMTYYDVIERVNDWFFKLNIEDQRNELIRTIKKCKIYSHYLFIEAGTVVFFFDISKHIVFDMELIDILNNDEKFKEHFIKNTNKRAVRKFKHRLIANFILKDRREQVSQYLLENMQIEYDLSELTNFITFVPLKGIQSINLTTEELEEAENQ
jgi:hypothetical protein